MILRQLGGVADIPSLQCFSGNFRVKLQSEREIFERKSLVEIFVSLGEPRRAKRQFECVAVPMEKSLCSIYERYETRIAMEIRARCDRSPANLAALVSWMHLCDQRGRQKLCAKTYSELLLDIGDGKTMTIVAARQIVEDLGLSVGETAVATFSPTNVILAVE